MWRQIGSGLRSAAYLMVLAVAILFGTEWLDRHHQDVVEKQETTVHQVLGKPYIHKGDDVENNVAHPGDLIFVHNDYIKTERCHVQVANLLINRENKYVLHESQFLNWFNAGKFEANEMFKLEDWLPEGTYRLIKRSTSFCGERVYYFVNFDVELKVVAKPKKELARRR
jgi:hypothetical protein